MFYCTDFSLNKSIDIQILFDLFVWWLLLNPDGRDDDGGKNVRGFL